MARIILQAIPERWKGLLQNISYDLQNRLFLTPDNLLAEDGDPRRLDVGLPGFTDGINIYVGLSQQTMVRQTQTPLAFHRSSYYLAEFDEDGHPPPEDVGQEDARTPGRAVLKDVSATAGGYQPGVYRLSFTGVNAAGKHTKLAPYVEVSILAGETGHNISVPLPNIPGDWASIGIWMTDPNEITTYWHQGNRDLGASRPSSIELQGPLRRQLKHPGTNQTFEGATATPSAGRVNGPHTLYAGEYAFWSVDVTASGDALPSAQKSHSVSTDQTREAISVGNGSKAASGIGWRCFVRQKDGRTYVVYPADSNPEQPLPYGTKIRATSIDPETWPTDSQGNPTDFAVAQRDLPVVDQSGLQDPLDPFDQPVKYGGTGLHSDGTSKRYYVGLTATIGGIEGPRGPAENILLASGRAMRIIIPKRVQKLRNPKQDEQGSDGFPLDVTITSPTTGGSVQSEPGQTRVTANQNNTGATPGVVTSPVAISRTEDYRIHGEIEIAGYTNGNGVQAVLQQLNSAGSVIVETPLTFETGFTLLDGVGTEEYDKGIKAQDNFWDPLAVTAQVAHVTPTGANGRNLQWIVRNTDFLEQEHLPEKARKRNREKGEADDPVTSPEDPTPEGPDYSPRKPKRKKDPKAGRAKPAPDRPTYPGQSIKTYGFEAGEDLSALTLTRLPADSFRISEIIADAAIDGALGWHCRDSGTTGNGGAALSQVFYSEAFSSPRKHLGVRPRMRVVGPPATNTTVEVVQMTDLSGANRLAVYYLENVSGATHLGVKVFGKDSQVTPVHDRIIARSVVAGDLFDIEPVAQGGGTDDGHVRFWMARNNGAYQIHADWDGVDWRGLDLQRYRFGICNQSAAAATIDLHFDSIAVTERGRTFVRERDDLGGVVYQGHWSYPKGHPVRQGVLPRTMRLAVKPSTTYVAGIFMRYVGVKGVQRPFYVTLHTLGGDTVDVGSLLGHGGAVGTAGWRDYVVTFTTPPDCFELRIAGYDIGPGKYVFQELCISEGAMADAPFTVNTTTNTLLATDHGIPSGRLVRVRNEGGVLPSPLDRFAYYWAVNATDGTLQLANERGGAPIALTTPGSGVHYLIRTQPRRTGLRAVEGSFRTTIDTRTPRVGRRGPHLRRTWRRGGSVVEELPAGTAVEEVYRSSPDRISYRGPYYEFSEVPRSHFLEFFTTLTGDGRFTPVIANESPFLEYELSDATLLREDGTEYPGGAVVLDLQSPVALPPVEVRERLDRRIVRHVLAADVGEIGGFKVQVFTEEAFEEIMNTWMKKLHRVEGRGRSVLIKPEEQLVLKQQPATQDLAALSDGSRYYYVYAAGDASRSEVVEETRL